MKKLIYAILILGVVFAVAQAKTVKSTNDTERRPYEVLKTEGDFEIRYYPPAVMASYTNSKKSDNSSFRVLAGYIFGGNEENTSIAMTSPVEMEGGDGQEMQFMMPSNWEKDSLPKPKNEGVKLIEVEGYYAATIRFGGYANAEKVEKQQQLLLNWMEEQELDSDGKMVQLGYNPPYPVLDRRNEVLYRLKNYKQ